MKVVELWSIKHHIFFKFFLKPPSSIDLLTMDHELLEIAVQRPPDLQSWTFMQEKMFKNVPIMSRDFVFGFPDQIFFSLSKIVDF